MPARYRKKIKEGLPGKGDRRYYQQHAWWACEIGAEAKASAPTKQDLLAQLGITPSAYRVRRRRAGMYEYEDKERGPNDQVVTMYVYTVAAGPVDGFPIEYQSEEPAASPEA
jgi:hypothetical protein